ARAMGGGEEHLSAGRFRIEHGNADHLGGERPETEQLLDLIPPGNALGALGQFFRFPEKVFLLDFIEVIEGEGRSLYVKYQLGHGNAEGVESGSQGGNV